MFEAADARLNVSIDILEDMILEPSETFFLILAVPGNPANNQLSGDETQVTVVIVDDEGGCMGAFVILDYFCELCMQPIIMRYLAWVRTITYCEILISKLIAYSHNYYYNLVCILI